MKKLFFIGLIGLGFFEVFKIYFIIPMPGSQQWDSLEFAYFLHFYRWILRGFFFALVLLESKKAFSNPPKWVPALGIDVVLFLLKSKKIVHDQIGILPFLLILSEDGQSFAAFKRTHKDQVFQLKNDTLYSDQATFDFIGKCLNSNAKNLVNLPSYQEFWHSWRTFHPFTETHNLIEPLL
jgi:hypothetical protein